MKWEGYNPNKQRFWTSPPHFIKDWSRAVVIVYNMWEYFMV